MAALSKQRDDVGERSQQWAQGTQTSGAYLGFVAAPHEPLENHCRAMEHPSPFPPLRCHSPLPAEAAPNSQPSGWSSSLLCRALQPQMGSE